MMIHEKYMMIYNVVMVWVTEVLVRDLFLFPPCYRMLWVRATNSPCNTGCFNILGILVCIHSTSATLYLDLLTLCLQGSQSVKNF